MRQSTDDAIAYCAPRIRQIPVYSDRDDDPETTELDESGYLQIVQKAHSGVDRIASTDDVLGEASYNYRVRVPTQHVVITMNPVSKLVSQS